MNESEYLTLKILARQLSVTPRTLRGWMRDPVDPLPGYKVKGTLLFRWAEIERWLDAHRVETVNLEAQVDEILNSLSTENRDE